MEESTPKTAPPKRSTKLLGNLILASVSTLLCLFVVEIALRVISIWQAPVTLDDLEAHRRAYKGREVHFGHMLVASQDRRMVYELIPNLDLLWAGHPVKTNSMGWRDHEFTLEKPPDTIRIAALGDSVTFGWLIGMEDTIPKALETVLNQFSKGPRFEVMNFGIPGYNTAMEHEVLAARALAFKPDVVVLQFEINDMDLPTFILKPENHWRLDKCYLWDFIRSRRWRWSRARTEVVSNLAGLELPKPGKEQEGKYRPQIDPERVPPEFMPMVGEENCQKEIRAIGRLCKEKGIGAVFALNPFVLECYSEEKPAAEDPDYYKPYVQAAAEGGFALADPTVPILQFMKTHNLNSGDLMLNVAVEDVHPSPVRAMLVALEEAKALIENGLLPEGAIDKSQLQEIADAFVRRAEAQWATSRRAAAPRLSDRAIRVFPEDHRHPAHHLGEGWYPVEITPWGEPFRWCGEEAKIVLPPAKRLVLEVGTDWPKKLGPPDQEFLLDEESLAYRVVSYRDRAWLDVTVPKQAKGEQSDSMEITLNCTPIARADLPANETRALGLRVLSIYMEPAD